MPIRELDNLPAYLAPLPYNQIIDTDSYKVPQWRFYRPGVRRIYSFLESRGGEHAELMLAGLQPLLYKLGQPVQDWEIEEAGEFFAKHFGFSSYMNRTMWDEIVHKHDRKLPLEIRAVPEGLMLPKKTPLLTSENTADLCAPLVGYKETMMMRDVWPASSIASRVFRMKQRLKPFFDETSDNGVSPFAVLDFMSRGVFGYDHSCLAGAVFTFFFGGSDNMPGIRYANYYYHSDMAAHSVAATEHSIASGFGYGNDDDYIDWCIDQAEPGSILSLVGDTWDIFKFTKALTREDRKNKIINKNLSVVDRPDSGGRARVLPDILRTLAQGFGTTRNSKGYDVLNYNAKALWADGMNENTITEPVAEAKKIGISSDSVMAGSGGGIGAADLDRDTDRWAFKASEYLMEDGTRIPVYKDPITDPGKTSKKGRFGVLRDEAGIFRTISRENDAEDHADLLEVHFRNGDVINPSTLDQIRERVEAQL
jgi:nicotinamide phosphoribosyltransferase